MVRLLRPHVRCLEESSAPGKAVGISTRVDGHGRLFDSRRARAEGDEDGILGCRRMHAGGRPLASTMAVLERRQAYFSVDKGACRAVQHAEKVVQGVACRLSSVALASFQCRARSCEHTLPSRPKVEARGCAQTTPRVSEDAEM
jgi:hypothetical protein